MDMYYADHGYSTCVTCEPGLSRKGRKEGGSFSAKFSGIFIFIIDSYYMDLSSCKSITKSFVM